MNCAAIQTFLSNYPNGGSLCSPIKSMKTHVLTNNKVCCDYLPLHLLHDWRDARQKKHINQATKGCVVWVWLTAFLLVGGLFLCFGLSLMADVSRGVVLGTGKSAGKNTPKVTELSNLITMAITQILTLPLMPWTVNQTTR